MALALGNTEEVCHTAEGQVNADKEVKAFLDKRCVEAEAQLAAALHANDTLEVQLETANNMKEYLSQQWTEASKQVVELEVRLSRLQNEKDEAVAKVRATDRLKRFLTQKLRVEPHDRGLILAVKDEWRKLLASDEGASLELGDYNARNEGGGD